MFSPPWRRGCALLLALLALGLSAPGARAAAAPARDDERLTRLTEQIRALQSVVDGAKNEVEKRRLEANLEQLKRELSILADRQAIEERQRVLAENLTASPLDTLREKLRTVDRTVEEGEARLRELVVQRKRVGAEREAIELQLRALIRENRPNTTARVAELEEAMFTKNEEVRALALQREAAEQEIELAREADRLRTAIKTVESTSKPTLRGLFEGYAKLRDDSKAEHQVSTLANNLEQNLRISQSSLDLSQLKLAKFDEELALLEKQSGFFSTNREVERLLAAQRSQKKALVERMPHIAAQVDALRRAQQAVAMRRELTALEASGRRDTLEAQKETYLLRLRWPGFCLAALLVVYVFIAWVWLPRRRKNEGLFLARRLSRYLHVLAATGIIAGFFFDDLSMVAAAFGLVSAALVIALKDVFTSIAAWLAMMVGGRMSIGDRVEIDGTKGDVLDIDLLRTTMLEVNGWLGSDQPTGRVISMPNNFIFTKKLFNYSHGHPYVWSKVEFTMTFSTPAGEAMALFKQVLEEETRTQFAEARVAASNMRLRYGVEDAIYEPKVRMRTADHGIVFGLFYVSHYKDLSSSRTRMTRRVITELESRPHMQFAYPTIQYMEDPKAPGHVSAPTATWGSTAS
ncbi:MAG: mechanosensitive ion channel [Opitutaceae bacterium]|nr:mechanosensitive ion channel [Opitutaceae bacterium]